MPELWELEEQERKKREDELRKEIARAQDQVRQLSSQLAQLTASLAETRRALTAKEEEFRALQAQGTEKEKALRQIQEEKATLEAAYRKALGEKAAIEKQKAAAEATVTRLQGELKGLRENALMWQRKAWDLERQSDTAKKQAAELQEQLAEAMERLEEYKGSAFWCQVLVVAGLVVAGLALWDIWQEHRQKMQGQVQTPSAWGVQGPAQAFGIRYG